MGRKAKKIEIREEDYKRLILPPCGTGQVEKVEF
jgi:hypothetical protein